MPLYFAEIKSDDFCFLHFYTEFCWLIEFSLVSFTIYIITNTVPEKFKWKGDSVPDDLNLSNVWLLLGFLFCAINLSRLSSRYLGSSGERSLLIMFGTFAFVGNRFKISFFLRIELGNYFTNPKRRNIEPAQGCLSALTLPSRVIELGFEELIDKLDRMSKLGLTLFISLFSAIFATAFTFPGFRTAQMNKDSANNVSLQNVLIIEL